MKNTATAKRQLRNRRKAALQINGLWLTNKLMLLKKRWEAEGNHAQLLWMQETVRSTAAAMRRMKPGWQRAVSVHGAVDAAMADDKKRDSTNYEKVTCKKGCAFCCYQHVAITDDEADLYARMIASGEAKVDLAKLERLAAVPSDDYAKIPPVERRCIFLSDDNTCSIYARRPLACRTYLVVSEPEKCNVAIDTQKVVSICAMEPEMIAAAANNIRVREEEFQSLPAKTLKRLKQIGRRLKEESEEVLRE